MKILRYEKNGKTGYGALQDDDSISELLGSPFDDYQVGGKVAELGEVNVLAPVQPSKIIGVGLNYILHIEESGAATPSFPMLFMKPPTGVIGQGDTIQVPNTDHRVEYEVELAVVMGKRTKNVSEEEALDYVLGYTCGNDVSDRDIQLAEMKMGAMAVGKGFDTYCPLGPADRDRPRPHQRRRQDAPQRRGEAKRQHVRHALLRRVPHFVYQLRHDIASRRRGHDGHAQRRWPNGRR